MSSLCSRSSVKSTVLSICDPAVLAGVIAFLSVFWPTVAQDRTVRHFSVFPVAVMAIFWTRPGLRFEVWTGCDFRIDAGFRPCPWSLANRAGGFIESQIWGPIPPAICSRDWFPWSDDYLVIVAEELAVPAFPVFHVSSPSMYFFTVSTWAAIFRTVFRIPGVTPPVFI